MSPRSFMRRPATLVTIAYLVLTLPLIAVGEWDTARKVMALLHVAALVLLLWSLPATRHPLPADWLPLLLVPFLYGELPYLMRESVVYHDPVVQRWEAALFGGQPARTLAGSMPSRAISEVLHLGYLLYYPIVYLPPLLLYLRGRREEYRRAALAIMLTYALCFLAFVVFPVEGPRYAWGAPPDIPGGPVRALTLVILERGSSRGTAFPSSHAAVAAAQAVVSLRYQPRVGLIVSVTSALLLLGAVYGGFHYAIDMIAGAVAGVVIAVAVLAARRSRA